MPNKMLIDASHPEETRVVVTRGNRIEEFDFESQDKKQLRGNIYLARVTRVEPSLQAAFVEYGGNRHGFLAFSEIHPDYYQIPVADRQALLRAEAEAARDEDDEDEEPRERSRATGGKRRRRGKRGRDGEGSKVEAAADGEADEQDESGEAGADEHETIDENVAVDEVDEKGKTSIAAEVSADVISEPVAIDADDEHPAHADDKEDVKVEEHVESVGAGDAMDEVRDRRRPPRRHYKIQEVIKRRQILLVQVVKEERGNKGAALTTYLSLAGRYSVLMPNTARGGGISRKITSAQDRKRLKDVVKDLEVPQGMGVILRTAGENRTKAEIKRDYEYLMRMWENVRELTLKSTAPKLVYEEGSLIKRSIRDLYNKDIDEIQVAGEDGYREAKDFMRMLMPSHAKMVQPYRDTTPIFARSGLEAQLDRMVQPQVTLKSGGYIIINQTEALVSIDVNSGRSTREHSIEDTALQTNLEASEEVARQLRLRDLAGLIVIDFIDMEEGRNNRAVEKRLKDCLKNDRARIQVGRISHFGLMEMSRQRIRASVLESTMKPCPHCGGTGHVRSDSSVALMVVRGIEEFLLKDNHYNIVVKTPTATALYVLNHKRGTLVSLEAKFGVTISLEADESVGAQHFAIFRGAQVENPIEIVETQPLPFVDENDHDDDIVEEIEDEEEGAEEAEKAPVAKRADAAEGQDGNGRRKRRRRRRGGRDRDAAPAAVGEASEDAVAEAGDAETDDGDADDEAEAPKAAQADSSAKKRRRGKRGGRRSREDGQQEESPTEEQSVEGDVQVAAEVAAEEPAPEPEQVEAPAERPAKKPRKGSKAAKAAEAAEKAAAEAAAEAKPPAVVEPVAEEPVVEAEAAPARRSNRRSTTAAAEPAAPKVSSAVANDSEPPAPKKGWWQRKGFF